MSKRRLGSGLAFNDLLFNVLIGFVMLFVIAFLMINPIAKKADIPVKAEFIVVLEWDEDARHSLFSAVKEVQRLMTEGGAERNHNRKGKCQSCSRRYACDSSLV